MTQKITPVVLATNTPAVDEHPCLPTTLYFRIYSVRPVADEKLDCYLVDSHRRCPDKPTFFEPFLNGTFGGLQ